MALLVTCGIDEAGRGPLAGPVCAAAVILPENFPTELLNDSKKLSVKQRWLAFTAIIDQAFWGVGWVFPQDIDKINILQASLLAMRKAYFNMDKTADMALIDGNKCPSLPISAKAIVKGDSKEPAIMAASIVAKTLRDDYMADLAKRDNRYGFEIHKGYPTQKHRIALELYGLSEFHRKTFQYKKPRQLEMF